MRDLRWTGLGPLSSAAVVCATLVVTYGWFQNDPGWNGYSRFDLVRALVEDGTTRIDHFHENTNDKSLFEGHYYSDKAPGTALLALPAYAGYLAWLDARRDVPRAGPPDPAEVRRGLYVASFVAVALPSALATGFFFLLACELGTGRRGALFATAALALGSLAFPYSTVFFGHSLCAALLIASFGLLALERRHSRTTGASWRAWRVALAGLAGGSAFITEFPAAAAVGLVGLYLLVTAPDRRLALAYTAGAALPLVPLAAYNQASFGNPLQIGYQHLSDAQFAEGMGRGVMGLTHPRPDAIWGILFGGWRGMVPLTPVVLLFAFGAWRMRRRRDLRPELALCTAVVAFFLLLNASYWAWHGGGSLGPRHVVPMLPFLALPLAFSVQRRILLPLGLLLVSVGHMAMGAALGVWVDERYANTLLDFVYPRFLAGTIPTLGASTNLGLELGLPGRASLLPLLALWTAAGLALLVPRPPQDARAGREPR